MQLVYTKDVDGSGKAILGKVTILLRHTATISVALAPEHQGRGLGRRLIAAGTEATLNTRGVQRVIAMIRPTNVASVRAFEAAGYTLVGEVRDTDVALLRYECLTPTTG